MVRSKPDESRDRADTGDKSMVRSKPDDMGVRANSSDPNIVIRCLVWLRSEFQRTLQGQSPRQALQRVGI
jgi:hypothetical protein